MKLFFAPNTRAVRVAWLLEELGLPYEIERFELGQAKMREPAYLAIHPMGRVPVLQDNGITIYESGAIVQYILSRYGNGRLEPAHDSEDYAVYLQWLHFCEGMLMPPINTIVVETVLLSPDRRNEVNVKRATKLLNQMLMVVNDQIDGYDYLAGDFSAADIMTGHAVITAGRHGGDFSDKPNLPPYIERLLERPALQHAMAL